MNVEDILKDFKWSLKEFGTYTFYDKGLEEVFATFCGDSTRNDVIYYCSAYRITDWRGEPHSKKAGRVAWVTPKKLTEGCFGEYNRKLLKQIGILFSD